MTDDERKVMSRAATVVQGAMDVAARPAAPVDRQPVVRIRCHPSSREWAEYWFEGEIVIDETMDPERVEVTPLAYAKDISVTIGFATDPQVN